MEQGVIERKRTAILGGLTLQQVLKLLDEKHSPLDQTQPWPIKTIDSQHK